MNKLLYGGLVCVVVMALASPVFADASADAGAAASGMGFKEWLTITIGFSLSLAVMAGAISQSRAISSAVEGMARQPEAAGAIRTALIIGLALIETLVIYMLLICFMLLGKFPA